MVHPQMRVGRDVIQLKRLTQPNAFGRPVRTDASPRRVRGAETAAGFLPIAVVEIGRLPTALGGPQVVTPSVDDLLGENRPRVGCEAGEYRGGDDDEVFHGLAWGQMKGQWGCFFGGGATSFTTERLLNFNNLLTGDGPGNEIARREIKVYCHSDVGRCGPDPRRVWRRVEIGPASS